MSSTGTNLLSDHARLEIDRWLKRYPQQQRRSGVMQALMIVQEENGGSLNETLMDAVADYLEMPQIAVREVATFYSMYNLKPVGRHVVNVCTNISCMLRGAEKVVARMEKKLGIRVGETTADGRITLREAECLAACAGAPACQIGRRYHENLTAEKADALLDGLE